MIYNRFVIGLVAAFAVLTGLGFSAYNFLHNRQLADQAALTLKKTDISVTVIEGKRWEEIAAQMAKAGVTNYQDFVSVMQAHPEWEGTLFPDTYRFFPDTTALDVIDKLRNNYTDRTGTLAPTDSQLVLASIVERESLNDTDRPIIAGVYANRLNASMTLGADPSVEYAKDTLAYKAAGNPESFSFWGAITQADYHNVVSPFNTYLQTGLPPYPICNPGIKSIEAAQNPNTSGGYLYFGYKNGKLLLAKTLLQHEQQLQ